ncbi:MAG: hypothetical protein HQK79_21945 [Desulfobacterales bacterium]|nr:hypothetical protein [Desulfobacterales bacterium]
MLKKISVVDATIDSLINLKQSIITDYQLGMIIFCLYTNQQYKNYPLRVKNKFPKKNDYKRILEILLNKGLLKNTENIKTAFYINDIIKIPINELLCSLDPFCYISHLSAMQFYGFINKEINIHYCTSPSLEEWKKLCLEKINIDSFKNLNQYLATDFPLLTHPKNISQNIICYSTSRLGKFNFFNYKKVRVSTIGRVFLDMLRKSEFCGGLETVINVFKQFAKPNLNYILDEIDEFGSQIEKVRAGYILEEICKIDNNEIINKWTENIQRGGSRKLDPSKSYSPTYSSKWCISINY